MISIGSQGCKSKAPSTCGYKPCDMIPLLFFCVCFAVGVLYGITNTCVGHPFDTLKTKMQAQLGYEKTSMFQTFTKTIRTQGVVGLYRYATFFNIHFLKPNTSINEKKKELAGCRFPDYPQMLVLLDKESGVGRSDKILVGARRWSCWQTCGSVQLILTLYHTIPTFNNPEKEAF